MRWKVNFWQSEEGRKLSRLPDAIEVTVREDGTFAAEDVPPGVYDWAALITQPAAANVAGNKGAFWFTHEVTVPEPGADRPAVPVDLGVIRVEPKAPNPTP